MNANVHDPNRRNRTTTNCGRLHRLLVVLLAGICWPTGTPLPMPVLAQPAPNLQIGSTAAPSLLLIGEPNRNYLIQASTNLSTWVSIATNRTASDGSLVFTDAEADAFPQRFYRAVLQATQSQTVPVFRSGRVLVKPKTGVVLSVPNLLLGASVLGSFPAIGNLQVVELPAGRSVEEAVADLNSNSLVEYAEPDYLVQSLATPNDFRYYDGTLWNLSNTGQFGGKPDADVDGPEGWDIQTLATNVIVAVIDTGMRHTHEDLAASMWVNPLEIAGNGIDDDGNGYVDDVHGINAITGSGNPLDDHGHGSHIGGTIGGVGNNGVGVVGICWQARIMALKFLDSHGEGSISDAIRCIDYARSKGAQIINASWGTTGFNSSALRDAIASARDADIVFVAACGNSAENNSVNPIYPASFNVDNIISVAATTRMDELAFFSNYGATNVHLAAPGSPIYSCWGDADNAYQYLDGTSMAAAQVSGACALVRAKYPGESHRQIMNRVLAGVDPLPSLAGKCTTGGRLNLQKALGGTSPPPTLPTVTVAASDATAAEPSNPGAFTLNRTGSTASALTVFFNLGGPAVHGSDYQSASGSVTIEAGAASASITITPIDDAQVEGEETVVLTVSANGGYSVGSPASASVTITDNDSPPAPPIVTLSAIDSSASETGPDAGVIRFNRTGDTSQPLTVNWTFSGNAANGSDFQPLPTTGSIPAGQAAADLTITPIDDSLVEGNETVVVTVVSGSGYTVGSSSSATVTIADNDQPPPPAPVANFTANPTSGNAPLTVQFTDQSTGSISMRDWNFGDGTAHSGAQNPSHTYNSAGTYTATLTVTGPGGGNSKSMTLMVTSPPPPQPSTVTVAASDGIASESGDTGSFTISRSGSTGSALTVNYTLSGTAQNGGDYQSLPGSVTIPAATSSASVIVRPNNDSSNEGSESVALTLANHAAYTVGSPNSATVIITDNDQTPDVRPYVSAIAIKPSASESGETGIITVARTGGTATALTVQYTLGGNAQNGVDYQSLSGSVTLPAGAASANVTIIPINDAAVEIDEPVYVMLAPGAGYIVDKPNGAAVTIQDNDQTPVPATVTASATDSTASETGDRATITISRTGSTVTGLTVYYTLGGNAQNGVDYQALSGSVTIPAGAASASVTIIPINDTDAEPDEPVYLMLGPGAGYTVGTPNGAAASILDNDR